MKHAVQRISSPEWAVWETVSEHDTFEEAARFAQAHRLDGYEARVRRPAQREERRDYTPVTHVKEPYTGRCENCGATGHRYCARHGIVERHTFFDGVHEIKRWVR